MPYPCTCLAQKNLKPLFGLDSNFIQQALFRKLDSLKEVPTGQLAGKMGVVIDLVTRLPIEIWFAENPKASDVNFE